MTAVSSRLAAWGGPRKPHLSGMDQPVPIPHRLFQRGLAEARAGRRRSAATLDLAPPEFAAGYLAGTCVDGCAAADLPTRMPARLVEHLYAAARALELPLPVGHVTRAAVALLGPGAEARARRHARSLFDWELEQDEVSEAQDPGSGRAAAG